LTPEAAQWHGYGTALKPAYEPIIVAMRPRERSFAKNALEWGVAGLNIAGTLIPANDKTTFPVGYASGWYGNADRTDDPFPNGRFPANVILDEEAGRLLDGQGPVSKGGKYRKSGQRDPRHRGKLLYGGGIGGGPQNAPDTYGDAGGISRFYYCPKATKQERNAGLEGLPIKQPNHQPNGHPTVKPLDLCRYLATLILPPQRDTPRKLLVPYAGTGSEMIGAIMAGWDEVLGIELDAEYVEIAQRRIGYWKKGVA
jgi:site-specific DNA-methyltransferase (adenine-specific)